jgi:hypothetical protein
MTSTSTLVIFLLLGLVFLTPINAAYTRCKNANLQGVVNQYAAGTTNVAKGATTLPVSFNPPIPANSLLYVYQVQGASYSTTDDANYGTVANYIAGTGEFVRTTSASGNSSVDLATPLKFQYLYRVGTTQVGTRKWQAVWVPEYMNVTFYATVTCTPWDGSVGGIVAFTARHIIIEDTLAIISAANKGFRGGAGKAASEPPNTEYLYVDACNRNGGVKGEGIGDSGLVGGKCYAGSPANGGGGSKDVATVSYGGSGGGAGVGTGNAKAQGGKALPPTDPAGNMNVFFGGGGGGGSQGYYGGRGGGIIIVIADSVSVPDDNNPYIVSELKLDVNGERLGWGAHGGSGTIWWNVNRYTNINDQAFYGITYPPVINFAGSAGGGALVWNNPNVPGANELSFYNDIGNGVTMSPFQAVPATC